MAAFESEEPRIKQNIVVGSYNMSFAGDRYKDAMPTFPSEYSFHLRDTAGARTFWNNAKQHLFNFINDKNPLAVGLQEMNLTDVPSEGGTAAIYAELKQDVYEMVSDKVTTNNAGISIIFNKTVAGDVLDKVIVDNPNQLNGANPPGGRPLLMVHTSNNYLFVNMHGAQNAALGRFEDDFNDYMVEKNKIFLETNVNKFLIEGRSTPITPDHIFIMGDFNDRYDAIREFIIGGKQVAYEGDSPKSCCHNWDSMGDVQINIEKSIGVAYINALRNNNTDDIKRITSIMNASEIPIPTDNGKLLPDNASLKVQGILPKGDPKRIIEETHGITVDKYINKGDKVFASGAFGPLEIYNSGSNLDNGISKASDHELVYMEFGGTLGGGKSRKSRKSKKGKKSRKSRKSKKSKKSRK